MSAIPAFRLDPGPNALAAYKEFTYYWASLDHYFHLRRWGPRAKTFTFSDATSSL